MLTNKTKLELIIKLHEHGLSAKGVTFRTRSSLKPMPLELPPLDYYEQSDREFSDILHVIGATHG